MEYEKKYNDLIARINEVKEKPRLCMKDKHHYNGYVETGIRDALDYIVSPESEDERIMKEIIEFLTDGIWSETTIDKVKQSQRYAKWIAYLEKQKDKVVEFDHDREQKPAEWMAGQGETFNGYISVKGKRSLIAIEGKSDIYKYGDKVVVQIRKK